jgi:hypothetical protein
MRKIAWELYSIRNGIKIFGYLFALTHQIILWITFLYIYLMCPTKSTNIYINEFGEANIEFCMMFIVIPISFCGFYYMFKDMIKKKE